MRKYPPSRYTKSMTNGAGSSIILSIITVCCPPLGLLAYVVYALFADWLNSMRR